MECSVESCVRQIEGNGFKSDEGECVIGLCEIHSAMTTEFCLEGIPLSHIAVNYGVSEDEILEAIKNELMGLWLEHLSPIEEQYAAAAFMGHKGGSATARKYGPDYFRTLAGMRKTRRGGRPRKSNTLPSGIPDASDNQ